MRIVTRCAVSLGEGMVLIKRRVVIYVHGYDPQGPTGYYDLFQRGWNKFRQAWPVQSDLGVLTIDSDDLAHWDVTTAGPNWSVATRYEFVRYDNILDANLAQPLPRQVARSLRWLFDDFLSGAALRIARTSWRFWCHLFALQLGLLLWITLSIAAGYFAAQAASAVFGVPSFVELCVGVIIAGIAFVALRPLAERWFIIRVNNCWPYLREFGRGEATGLDRPVETGAERLKAAVTSKQADEIVVIGHSGGGPLAQAVVARALASDPDLGRRGSPITLLTLGSVMAGIALHPQANRMRDVIRRIAVEPTIRWIDCQSRKDPMNFWDFDPVAGSGVQLGSERCNPLVWKVRFRDMLSPGYYKRIRANFFRLHYQFIMGSDQRAPYDFFMLVAGPLPATQWAERGRDTLAEFDADATYAGPAAATRLEPTAPAVG